MKKVLVLGGGTAGVETAIFLKKKDLMLSLFLTEIFSIYILYPYGSQQVRLV